MTCGPDPREFRVDTATASRRSHRHAFQETPTISPHFPCRASALALLLALGLAPPVQAQDLFGRLLDRARERVEQAAERQIDRAMRPGEPRREPDARGGRRDTPETATAGPTRMEVTGGPSATERVSGAPQNLWLNVASGQKFEPVEGAPQIISTNPYLSPPDFLFESLSGMACAPDGGLVVSGKGWENGGYGPVGWWRIAADGAVTPIATYDAGTRTTQPLHHTFGLGRDGGWLSVSRNALFRVRDGVSERLAGSDDETGGYRDGPASSALFDEPGRPVEDSQGNVWVADQDDCVLRRIGADGQVSTVIARDRTSCEGDPEGEAVALTAMAWDAVNGEIVVGGSLGVGGGVHDRQTTIWRIRPDGTMRRVYRAAKNGASENGQNMDGIRALTVDPSGAIIVASKDMDTYARRQILRLDEQTERLVALTGQAYSRDDARPGRQEDPYDGPATRANFRETNALCRAPDGTIFVLDEHLVRRLNTDGTVRTWAY